MSVEAGDFSWSFNYRGEDEDSDKENTDDYRSTLSRGQPTRRKKSSLKVRESQEVVVSQEESKFSCSK